jgi:hypothetical protein
MPLTIGIPLQRFKAMQAAASDMCFEQTHDQNTRRRTMRVESLLCPHGAQTFKH